VCLACPSICTACTSLAVCTACADTYFLRVDKYCYTTCLVRYFANSGNNTCTNCPYDCLTCNPNGSCLSCDITTDFRTLNGTRCIPIPGYFDNITHISAKCPQACALCLNITYCINCNNRNFLNYLNQCNSSCPVRYYPINAILICANCTYDCYTCDSTGCLSCNATTDFRQLNSSSRRCVPLKGYFESNSTTSTACPAVCSACTSLT